MSYSNHIKYLVEKYETEEDVTIGDIVEHAKVRVQEENYYENRRIKRINENPKIYHLKQFKFNKA